MEDMNIKRNDLLGSGQFGSVFSGEYRGANCALKQVSDIDHYVKEGEVFSQVSSHPNICRFYGLWIDENKDEVFIVMDLYKNGSLLQSFQGEVPVIFSFEEEIDICSQLCNGLHHLHREKVIHADLALRNTLVRIEDGRRRVVLTDFGLSISTKKNDPVQEKPVAVAIRWASPELLETQKPSFNSDVWSLGIMFWELFNRGRTPYEHLENGEVVSGLFAKELTPDLTNIPFAAREIVKRHFFDTNARITTKESMHAWKNLAQKPIKGHPRMIEGPQEMKRGDHEQTTQKKDDNLPIC